MTETYIQTPPKPEDLRIHDITCEGVKLLPGVRVDARLYLRTYPCEGEKHWIPLLEWFDLAGNSFLVELDPKLHWDDFLPVAIDLRCLIPEANSDPGGDALKKRLVSSLSALFAKDVALRITHWKACAFDCVLQWKNVTFSCRIPHADGRIYIPGIRSVEISSVLELHS